MANPFCVSLHTFIPTMLLCVFHFLFLSERHRGSLYRSQSDQMIKHRMENDPFYPKLNGRKFLGDRAAKTNGHI